MDLLLSVFAPYCGEEFLRVLKPDGQFIMIIPCENHLYGLKEAIYEKPYRNEVDVYKRQMQHLPGMIFCLDFTCCGRSLPQPFSFSASPCRIRDTARRAGAVPAPQAASGRRIRPADELPCGPSLALLLPLHPTSFYDDAVLLQDRGGGPAEAAGENGADDAGGICGAEI